MKPKIFPIGFWNYTHTENLLPEIAKDRADPKVYVKDWADAGMTLAMSPEYDPEKTPPARLLAILDEAAIAGIAVIVCDKRAHYATIASGEEKARNGFKAAFFDFGHHSAVFGFHIGDEPNAKAFPDVCLMHKIQKEIAPKLTPFCNLFPWHPGAERLVGYSTWSTYLDAYAKKANPELISYDCYTQMNPPEHPWSLDMYFRNLREYWEAGLRSELPYWTTLLSVGHFQYRCPTEDDFRWQINTAVAHGAKGLLWFFFYMRMPHDNYRVAPIDEHWERTETFTNLSRINRTFLKSHAALLSGLTLKYVGHVGSAWGGFTLISGMGALANAISRNKTPLILSEFADIKGRTYIAVVNNSQTACTQVEMRFRGQQLVLYRIGWEGREEKVERGDGWSMQIKDGFTTIFPWLSPGQMEIYRLEDPNLT